MKITKHEGRELAKKMRELTGKQIDFIEHQDAGLLSFQITQKKLYKVIELDGSVIPSETTDNLLHPRSGEYVYGEINCYPEQVDNGDLKFFIEHGLTQIPKNH